MTIINNDNALGNIGLKRMLIIHVILVNVYLVILVFLNYKISNITLRKGYV
jgi:hypothetical protein